MRGLASSFSTALFVLIATLLLVLVLPAAAIATIAFGTPGPGGLRNQVVRRLWRLVRTGTVLMVR